MDIAPTLLTIAGASYPRRYEGHDVLPMRGSSMAPLLAGQLDYVHPEDEPLGWEMMGWRGIRMGDWKATWIPAPFGAGDWELFDLTADPGESRDLADRHPETIHRLIELWEAYADEVGVILAEAEWPIGQ
jgi:arylsulfatase